MDELGLYRRRKEVEAALREHEDAILAGNFPSWEEYKSACGVRTGLLLARNIMEGNYDKPNPTAS